MKQEEKEESNKEKRKTEIKPTCSQVTAELLDCRPERNLKMVTETPHEFMNLQNILAVEWVLCVLILQTKEQGNSFKVLLPCATVL